MYKGSCLCGSVQYEVEGEFGPAFYCHCQRCRKASGSAYASNAMIKPEQFRLLQGEESFKTFVNEANGVRRKFCGNCGSPIISERTQPPVLAVRLGSLDTPLEKGPQGHIFVASKADWDAIHDDLPQYDERPK